MPRTWTSYAAETAYVSPDRGKVHAGTFALVYIGRPGSEIDR